MSEFKNRPKFISTNALRGFLEENGRIEYEVNFLDEKKVWFVWGVYPDGNRQQVYVGRTGEECILKSPAALVAHHLTYYPDAESVTIPLKTTPT